MSRHKSFVSFPLHILAGTYYHSFHLFPYARAFGLLCGKVCWSSSLHLSSSSRGKTEALYSLHAKLKNDHSLPSLLPSNTRSELTAERWRGERAYLRHSVDLISLTFPIFVSGRREIHSKPQTALQYAPMTERGEGKALTRSNFYDRQRRVEGVGVRYKHPVCEYNAKVQKFSTFLFANEPQKLSTAIFSATDRVSGGQTEDQ